MAFLCSIWCEYGLCRSCMVQKECETIFIWICCAAASANICKRHTNNLQPPDECESVSSLLKAGASTPVKATASLLMWSVISSELALLQHGGSRSVGKTSVKEKRGSVYLSLLVGHDSHFDLSADQLLDRLVGSRSHKVTVSATKGLA